GSKYLLPNEAVPSEDTEVPNVVHSFENGTWKSAVVTSDVPQPQATEVVQYTFVDQDFLGIQVTEEEVISETWDNGQQPEDDSQRYVELKVACNPTTDPEEIEIPLPKDQDAYTTMRPYPCDFCSRRFRKKATLMTHMLTHQNDRLQNCNLCGAHYRRKCELINHMKIHAYAPGLESDDDDVPTNNSHDNTISKGRRKKAQSAAPKKRKSIATTSHSNYLDDDDNSYNSRDYKKSNHSNMPSPSHARVHAGDSPFECNTCGEMFWDVSLLKEHSRIKHAGRSRDESDTSGPYTGDDRFGEFNCDTCGLGFHRQDLLKRHRRIHIKIEPDSSGSDHVCQVCGQTFADQGELLAHAETHARYQPHRCMLCGECFLDAQAVAAHVRKRHARNIPPNACTLCGKTCKDRRSLQKHAWVHSAERSFSCHKCGKRFHSRARLKRHMVSHRDKAVFCDECGLEFPDGRALINHRHSHSKEPSARQFECAECGKTFGSRSSQQIHARIHTGERPYGCRFCWKAFADGGTLRKHERIHTGEKPYACAVCPRAFNQRVVLREHIRSHHSGPESRSSGSHAPVYVCKVCAAAFSSSDQLCAHLIQHSDENTAKQRMPKLGPRKYKRRRKLNALEIPALPNAAPSTTQGDISDDDLDSDDDANYKRKIGKRKYKQKGKSEDNLHSTLMKDLETVMENFNSIVSHPKSEPAKEKLDKKKHKTKRRAGMDGKFGMNNSKSRTHVTSGGFVRNTRPGESRVRPRTKNVTVSSLAALKAATSKKAKSHSKTGKDVSSRVGPRTKNVNYHNVKMSKLPTATFPGKSKTSERNASKEKVESKKEDKQNTVVRSENSKVVLPSNLDSNKEVKVEFTCEMCSETFTKRSELLIHVPIHI
ncbi:hypothetical protein L9F63_012535, partial [Diploptera punctata]